MDIYKEDLILRAKKFTEENVKPIAKELDVNNRCPEELFDLMREEGFFKSQFPLEYGGYEKKYETAFNILREIAKGSPGISLLYVVHWMATDMLLKYGTDDQKERYLKDLVEGKKIASYSVSEEVAGSDIAGIETVAEKVEDGWKLNGTKYYVTNGSIADLFFVLCKTSLDKGSRGMSLFIIEKETRGVDITYCADKMGFRSSVTTNLVLKDCIVSEGNLLGKVDKGLKIALEGLVGGRLGMAAIGVGISEIAFYEAIEHSNNREAFGKPISKLFSIQDKISDMYVRLEGSKALFYKACEARDKGEDYSLEASVAKVAAGEAVNRICYEAIQIMGGAGYISDNNVERYYRDGRLLDIGVGTKEVLNMIIGSTVLSKNNK